MTTESVSPDTIPLAPYVEVVTANKAALATKYLKNGYTLLHVMSGQQLTGPDKVTGAPYVLRKFPVFVLGRTLNVAPWEPEQNGGSR